MPCEQHKLKIYDSPSQSTINMFTNFTSQYYKRFFSDFPGQVYHFFHSLLSFVFASIVMSFETINVEIGAGNV